MQGVVKNSATRPDSDLCKSEHALVSDGTCLFTPDGRRLVRCTAEPVTYRVPEGVRHIEPRAFAFQRKLEQVELPEGLLSIGDEAFYACNVLARINVPSSVHTIGARAFFCSAFTHMHLPAKLEHLGDMALVSIANLQDRSQQCPDATPLPSITVDSDNPRFFIDCGFLCEREDDGTTRAIRYAANEPVVRIPKDVTQICSYALLGAKATQALHLHAHIEHLGTNAIIAYQPIDYIRVDLPDNTVLMLYPTESRRALPNDLICGPEGIAQLARNCDASLMTMKQGPRRTRRIIARMLNGRLLSEQHRTMIRNALDRELDASIQQFSRADDETSLRGLITLGVINGKNIEHAVETANRMGSVAATHALLDESQHMRRMRSVLSLDL
ncbi:MAG: leucine-rich repeat domain-containing protein [Eggerthellaceae bacterium]|nr:leucine-rich repeat domain-containing protein [Eggerthellaceae bacterium]